MTDLATPETTVSTDQPVRPGKLAHVVLRTRDHLEEMIAWYRTVRAADMIYRNERIAFLSYDEEHHRIAIAGGPDMADRPHRAVGLDHIAFTYDRLADLLSTYARLKGEGILPFCNVNHGPTTSLYYLDPDDNRIELQIDNFEDMHDATDLMVDRFDVNPVGVEFDADEWIARLNGGERPQDIVRLPTEQAPPTTQLITRLRSS